MGNAAATLNIILSSDDGFDSSVFEDGSHQDFANDLQFLSHLPKGWHQAGKRLYGIAYVDVKEAINAASFDLILHGEEKAWVTVMDYETHTQINKHHDDTRRIFDVKIPLVEGFDQNIVQPGRYQYPFKVDIPDFLPGTMREKHTDGGGEIKYRITAQLHGSEEFVGRHYTRPLRLLPVSLPHESSPAYVKPRSEEVSVCGCFQRGSLILGSYVNDTCLAREDVARVGVGCINSSPLNLDFVTAQLIETLKLNAKGYHRKFENVLSQSILQGVSVDTAQPHNPTHKYSQLYRMMNKSNMEIKVNIPKHAKDSYCSSALKVQHHIEVEACTSGCIATRLKLKLPVQIAPRLPQNKSQRAVSFNLMAIADNIKKDLVDHDNESSDDEDGDKGKIDVQLWRHSSIIMKTVHVESDDGVVLFPAYDVRASVPSAATLFNQQKFVHSNQKLFFQKKCLNNDWASKISSFTPSHFGILISQVEPKLDEPIVAECLAKRINNGVLTAAYCIEALHSASNYNRVAMVRKLLPFCNTDEDGMKLIIKELSDWEKIVLQHDFEVIGRISLRHLKI